MPPQRKRRDPEERERDARNGHGAKGDRSSRRYHLHTTISAETEERLNSLSSKFGNYARVVEEAVELLSVRESMSPATDKGNVDAATIWHLLRSELNMVAVGKTTFLSYIATLPRKALVDNNAIEVIEWFYGFKNITELATRDVLLAIKKIWMSGNYFKDVKVEEVEPGRFRALFVHDMNDAKYSEYWATYFQVLLEEKLGRAVKVLVRPQIFHMEIQERGKADKQERPTREPR
ncbi:MAG: hypothetical protein JW839_04880 [Candidatus Lokiarchaeota archaeon]|nr:hypothetical protein [Candidatus Lokiarchaeota archaeon]